uniref:Gastrin-releasing peptide n=1 Tax=Rousettus aegyptiacus TaxID=9407 RepID=A0A7J8DHC5_ROUAE|nr:gastrin releasing peptide [Rousettus aegyptiacus]
MRCRELPLVLLALVLCQAPRGPAAPVPAAGDTVLAKMYPRGNHWAVGHLMGKKSTGETPHVYESGSLKQQLREYLLWQEAVQDKVLSVKEGTPAELTMAFTASQRSKANPRRSCVPWASALQDHRQDFLCAK